MWDLEKEIKEMKKNETSLQRVLLVMAMVETTKW